MAPPTPDYEGFYQNQIVFLTGATGGLGGCLLYKLAVELPTKKLFVLCRSESKARESWAHSMPSHIESIFETGKIELVVGDVTHENFGITSDQRDRISAQTTIVIHSAADISLIAKLPATIRNNCLPSLELAKWASSFPKLVSFVQMSTGYSNGHLPHGVIEELFYPTGDPELELEQSLSNGTTQYADRFPKPYSYSKHIMERLLVLRNPNLPLLIVRPTIIGSAVKSPFPGYGPTSAMPFEAFFKFMSINPGSGVFHPSKGHVSGTNLFDEIPVDWVSNMTLLHIAAGTTGPVHASSGLWFQRTFDGILDSLSGEGGRPKVVYVTDGSIKPCFWASLFSVAMRDWSFSSERSEKFKDVKGLLSIDVDDVDLDAYDRIRVEKVKKDVESSRKALLAKI